MMSTSMAASHQRGSDNSTARPAASVAVSPASVKRRRNGAQDVRGSGGVRRIAQLADERKPEPCILRRHRITALHVAAFRFRSRGITRRTHQCCLVRGGCIFIRRWRNAAGRLRGGRRGRTVVPRPFEAPRWCTPSFASSLTDGGQGSWPAALMGEVAEAMTMKASPGKPAGGDPMVERQIVQASVR